MFKIEKTNEIIKKKEKIDKETASADFQRFASDWHLDIDESEMDEDDKRDFLTLKKRIMRAIQDGNLIYNSDETFTFYYYKPTVDTEDGRVTKITRPNPGNYLAMDNYKTDQTSHKTSAVIAKMINMQPAFVNNKIDGIDYKILISILTLFSAS